MRACAWLVLTGFVLIAGASSCGGGGGAGGSGGEGAANSASSGGACKPGGASCAGLSECCSGACSDQICTSCGQDGDTCPGGVCVQEVCVACKVASDFCSESSECCSGSCDSAGFCACDGGATCEGWLDSTAEYGVLCGPAKLRADEFIACICQECAAECDPSCHDLIATKTSPNPQCKDCASAAAGSACSGDFNTCGDN